LEEDVALEERAAADEDVREEPDDEDDEGNGGEEVCARLVRSLTVWLPTVPPTGRRSSEGELDPPGP
jgi:hypothetical protein